MKFKSAVMAGVLTATVITGSAAPALADGNAVVRNVVIVGAAVAAFVSNYNHKKRIKREEMREQSRRQTAYRTWYYEHYGYYPSDAQFRDWYTRRYRVNPT